MQSADSDVIHTQCKVSDLCSTIEKLKQLRKKAEAAFYSTSNQLEENHQVHFFPSFSCHGYRYLCNSLQLLVYSDAIELLSVDVYRLRCYIASLRATEQPNPEVTYLVVQIFSLYCIVTWHHA